MNIREREREREFKKYFLIEKEFLLFFGGI